jgi:hypothetical protein
VHEIPLGRRHHLAVPVEAAGQSRRALGPDRPDWPDRSDRSDVTDITRRTAGPHLADNVDRDFSHQTSIA